MEKELIMNYRDLLTTQPLFEFIQTQPHLLNVLEESISKLTSSGAWLITDTKRNIIIEETNHDFGKESKVYTHIEQIFTGYYWYSYSLMNIVTIFLCLSYIQTIITIAIT